MDERDARAEVANRARDLEVYRAVLNNLLVQLAVLAPNEGREGRHRYR